MPTKTNPPSGTPKASVRRRRRKRSWSEQQTVGSLPVDATFEPVPASALVVRSRRPGAEQQAGGNAPFETTPASARRRRRKRRWGAAAVVDSLPEDASLRLNASARKLDRLIATIGGLNATARALDVDPSQLSLAHKKGRITYEMESRISDLEYVLDRALQALWPDEVVPWLNSPEPLLGGAIPLNVLILHGPAPVISALDARSAGAYA
jgi:hypothetical protein